MTTTELSEIVADVLSLLSQRPDIIKQVLDEKLAQPTCEEIEEKPVEPTGCYDKFEEYAGLNPEDCVILDTETTGLGHGDRIVELSVIDLHGNTLYNQLFDPLMPMPITQAE